MYNDDHIANYIVPATGTVPPTEPIGRIRHLMESDNLASVIVAEDNRPVGMIRRNDVFNGARLPDFCLARDIMLPNCPTLQVNSPADEARNSLDVTNLDRLPVVNANGELLGVVPRSALRRSASASSASANSITSS